MIIISRLLVKKQSSGILKLNTDFKSFKLDSIVINKLPLLESPAIIDSSDIIDNNTPIYDIKGDRKSPIIKLFETNSERIVVINGETFGSGAFNFIKIRIHLKNVSYVPYFNSISILC